MVPRLSRQRREVDVGLDHVGRVAGRGDERRRSCRPCRWWSGRRRRSSRWRRSRCRACRSSPGSRNAVRVHPVIDEPGSSSTSDPCSRRRRAPQSTWSRNRAVAARAPWCCDFPGAWRSLSPSGPGERRRTGRFRCLPPGSQAAELAWSRDVQPAVTPVSRSVTARQDHEAERARHSGRAAPLFAGGHVRRCRVKTSHRENPSRARNRVTACVTNPFRSAVTLPGPRVRMSPVGRNCAVMGLAAAGAARAVPARAGSLPRPLSSRCQATPLRYSAAARRVARRRRWSCCRRRRSPPRSAG